MHVCAMGWGDRRPGEARKGDVERENGGRIVGSDVEKRGWEMLEGRKREERWARWRGDGRMSCRGRDGCSGKYRL